MTFLYSLTNLKARIIMAYSLNSNYLWTNCIYLTEEGRNMAERVKEICDVVDDTGWRGISKEERDDFCRIFEKIIQNLEEGEEKSYGTKTS